jgi:serine/threonine protein kinase
MRADQRRAEASELMQANEQPQRSTRLGPYHLLAEIGAGGMGTVHLAKMDGPAGFNKLAVVKELRTELAGSREFVELFLDEARLAARLTHPNVVHTYGANEDAGRLYLALEYLEGQPWSRVRHALWSRGELPFVLHVKVLAEVLAGLHHAHELRDYDGTPLQVVHCDVSPPNVFVTYEGQVKVVDFGVARAVNAKARSSPDMIVGKLSYMAPEQARGEVLDRRADVFSVGVMLWEALAGRRFADSDQPSEIRRRRAIGAEPRLKEVAPNVPAGLIEICDRALALRPEDRFASAALFREALLRCLNEEFQDVDRAHLGELISVNFEQERSRVHRLIARHLKDSLPHKSSIEDLVASLRPGESTEYTMRADLTELASVSRLPDEAAVIEASSTAQVRLLRRRVPAAWVVAAIGLLLLVAATWSLDSNEAGHSAEGVRERSIPLDPLQPPSAAEVTVSSALTSTATPSAPPGAIASGPQLQAADKPASTSTGAAHVNATHLRRPLRHSSAPPEPGASLAAPEPPARESTPAARSRPRPADPYDTPLSKSLGLRPIYDEDPYQ